MTATGNHTASMARVFLLAFILALSAGSATAATFYDEAIDGDLPSYSGGQSPPIVGTLSLGVNELLGSVDTGDEEDGFGVALPAHLLISEIRLITTNFVMSGGPAELIVANAAQTNAGFNQFPSDGEWLPIGLLLPMSDPGLFAVSSLGQSAFDYRWRITATAVPEPSTAAMMALGLAGIARQGRRGR